MSAAGDDWRPLRSVLFMPADNPRAIAKARTLPCDAVVLDLEDAVAPERKAAARETAASELATGGFGRRTMVVRANASDTEAFADDLAAFAAAPIAALLVPKVESADEVARISAAMDAAGYPAEIRLWAMIETPRAILDLPAIAATAARTRLAAFALGLNDLAKETGIRQLPGRAAFLPVMVQAVMAARAHGVAILDGVCNDFADLARIEAEASQARDLGFDGKSLIHPNQVEPANRLFAPDPATLDEARAIVAAFADPAAEAKGAVQLGGRMIELLHRDEARRLLARWDAAG